MSNYIIRKQLQAPPFIQRDSVLSNKYWNIYSKEFIGMVSGADGTAFNFHTDSAGNGQCRTTHLTSSTEAPFDYFRVIVKSLDTANLASAVKAAFAPTSRIDGATAANAGSIITPNGTWVDITWSAAADFTMPTATSTNLTNTLASDWMPCSSIDRADITSPGPYYFMLRFEFPASASTVYTRDNAGTTTYDTDVLLPNRRHFMTTQMNVLAVSTPSLLTSTGNNTGFPSCVIQFRTRGRVLSLMTVGDSIACGTGSNSGALGYGVRSVLATTSATYPISLVNNGRGSQTSANYLANAKTMISACTPQMCTYPVWSPNDGSLTQAKVDTQMAQAMDFIAHCRANDCLPILLTPTPETTDSGAITTLKLQIQTKLRDMATRGTHIVDMYATTTDGTLGGSGGMTWISGYNSDATHPNDTGHSAMAVPLIAKIRDIVSANTF